MTIVQQKFACVILIILLCLTGAVWLIPCNDVFAADNENALPTISVENKTIHRGQTFDVAVNIDNNPGLISIILELEYDDSVMHLKNVTRGSALKNLTYTATNTETENGYFVKPFKMLWDGVNQDTTTGCMVVMTFESEITADIGDYPITLTYDANNTNSEYGQSIEVEIDNALITFISGKYKVIYQNYDGKVLYEQDYNEDDIPAYIGATPVRQADEKYMYEFDKFVGVSSDTIGVIIYKADYKTVPQEYQVLFYVDEEYFSADLCGYGTEIDLTNIPSQKNYNFSGWFLDEDYTQRLSFSVMPANNLVLYGYMKYNIREHGVPQIVLTPYEQTDDYVWIDVNITNNPSLAGLVLTLQYDDVFEFVAYEQGDIFAGFQFDHTGSSHQAQNFKFYWESAVNSSETGTLITLKFAINPNATAGVYAISLSYNEKEDATFFTTNSELWYTKLDITPANVAVGKVYLVEGEAENNIKVIVTVSAGISPDIYLEIKRITPSIQLPEETILMYAGEEMELKDAYSIRFLQNGEEVILTQNAVVKIQLTDIQKLCTNLLVFKIDSETSLSSYSTNIEDDYIVFQTNQLSKVAIIGNILDGSFGYNVPYNTQILLIGLSFLTISLMGLVLLLIVRIKKKNYKEEL